jgi:tetratricopeptide (TPR) repeat protein
MKPRNPLKSKSPMGGNILRCCGIALILVATSSGAFFSSTPNLFALAGPQAGPLEPSPDELRQMLSIAEAQHEIVKLRISQGRFDLVLPEIKKIFDLKLPDKYEGNVAQSACLLANDLVESKQFPLAHEVLDQALRRMKLNENKASVLKIQAYVFKSEGNLDKALQCLERAIELEKQRNRL